MNPSTDTWEKMFQPPAGVFLRCVAGFFGDTFGMCLCSRSLNEIIRSPTEDRAEALSSVGERVTLVLYVYRRDSRAKTQWAKTPAHRPPMVWQAMARPVR